MKKVRLLVAFLLASLLCCGSVFAIDDIFNTTGEIKEDPVFGGIQFTIPEGYICTSSTSTQGNYEHNGDTIILVARQMDNTYVPEDGHLRTSSDTMLLYILSTTSAKLKFDKTSYSDTTIAGFDSCAFYAHHSDDLFNFYITTTYVPDLKCYVFTLGGFAIGEDDQDAYAEMLKNAVYVGETSAPPTTTTQPTSIGSDVENYTTEDIKEDLNTVGEAINDYGAMIDNINNGDLGAAIGNLGDMYGKIGKMYD